MHAGCSNGMDGCTSACALSGLPSIGPSVHFHSRRRLTRSCRGVCGVEEYGSASIPSSNATARICRSMCRVRRFLRSSLDSVCVPVSSALPSSVLDSDTDILLESESDSDPDPGPGLDPLLTLTAVWVLAWVWVCMWMSVVAAAPLSSSCTASSSSRTRSKCCAVYRSVRISSSRMCRKLTCFLAGKKTRRTPAPPGPLVPAEMEPERRREAPSSGELRRMLRTPSGRV